MLPWPARRHVSSAVGAITAKVRNQAMAFGTVAVLATWMSGVAGLAAPAIAARGSTLASSPPASRAPLFARRTLLLLDGDDYANDEDDDEEEDGMALVPEKGIDWDGAWQRFCVDEAIGLRVGGSAPGFGASAMSDALPVAVALAAFALVLHAHVQHTGGIVITPDGIFTLIEKQRLVARVGALMFLAQPSLLHHRVSPAPRVCRAAQALPTTQVLLLRSLSGLGLAF